MSEVVYNDRYMVKTPYGFVNFSGISKKYGKEVFIKLQKSSIKCSLNHLIKTNKGFKRASSLSVGTLICPNEKVVSISLSKESDLYDLLDVDNQENSYYTNEIISHNCEFAGSSATLVEGQFLVKVPFTKPIKTNADETIRYFEAPIKGHQYVMTVDVSRGRDMDFSAFIVYDVTTLPYKVVCTFKDNTISTIKYPIIIEQVAKGYNKALILVENNDLGESVCNDLWFTQEYPNVLWTKNGKIAAGKDAIIGLKTTKQVKVRGCGAIKDIIEKDQLVINDFRIIEELGVYVQNNRGSYEAQDTHINDDLCSCLFLFGYFTLLDYFTELTDINTSKKLINRYEEQMENDIVPVGFFPEQTDEVQFDRLSQDQIDLLTNRLSDSQISLLNS